MTPQIETRRHKMVERVCVVCNKKKSVKGGRICEKDHFVCREDVYSGLVFVAERKTCPLDGKPLW
jgi:hypothetical protein